MPIFKVISLDQGSIGDIVYEYNSPIQTNLEGLSVKRYTQLPVPNGAVAGAMKAQFDAQSRTWSLVEDPIKLAQAKLKMMGEVKEEILSRIRKYDWALLNNVRLSQTKIDQIKAYREALRVLPSTITDIVSFYRDPAYPVDPNLGPDEEFKDPAQAVAGAAALSASPDPVDSLMASVEPVQPEQNPIVEYVVNSPKLQEMLDKQTQEKVSAAVQSPEQILNAVLESAQVKELIVSVADKRVEMAVPKPNAVDPKELADAVISWALNGNMTDLLNIREKLATISSSSEIQTQNKDTSVFSSIKKWFS